MHDVLRGFAKTVRRSVDRRRKNRDHLLPFPPGYFSPSDLVDIYNEIRDALLLSVRSIDAKGDKNSEGPVRTNKYISVQPYVEAQNTVRWLLSGGRSWRYVDLDAFTTQVSLITRKLAKITVVEKQVRSPVVFVVDSFFKSSFWVLMLVLRELRENQNHDRIQRHVTSTSTSTAGIADIHLVVDVSEAGTLQAFKLLPPHAIMCFVDDAAYTALQIKTFHKRIYRLWDSVHNGNGSDIGSTRSRNVIPRTIFFLPFCSGRALASLTLSADRKRREDVVVLNGIRIPSLFEKRSTENILMNDIYYASAPSSDAAFDPSKWRSMDTDTDTDLDRDRDRDRYRHRNRREAPTFHSFLFDRLMLDMRHSAFVFEHKIPDAVSIPFVWLHLGPCYPEAATIAYKIRGGARLQDLMTYLQEDDYAYRGDARDGTQLTVDAKTASERVVSLMQSPRFRSYYMRRIELTPPSGGKGKIVLSKGFSRVARARKSGLYPLLTPRMCDADYKLFMKRVLKEAEANTKKGATVDTDGAINSGWVRDLPECRHPPYRGSRFVAKLDNSVGLRRGSYFEARET